MQKRLALFLSKLAGVKRCDKRKVRNQNIYSICLQYGVILYHLWSHGHIWYYCIGNKRRLESLKGLLAF